MTLQDMYDYETYYHLSMRPERMAKFAVHYEAFKMIKNVPGSIVEAGSTASLHKNLNSAAAVAAPSPLAPVTEHSNKLPNAPPCFK